LIIIGGLAVAAVYYFSPSTLLTIMPSFLR
jgi:hypothetical protein